MEGRPSVTHRLGWASGVLLSIGLFAGCGGDSDGADPGRNSGGTTTLTGGSAGTGGSADGVGGSSGGAGGSTGGAAGSAGTGGDGGRAGGTGGSAGGTGGSTGGDGGSSGGSGGTSGGTGGSPGGTGGSTGGAGGATGGTGGSTGGAGGSTGGTGGSGTAAQLQPGECRNDADCGANESCVPSVRPALWGPVCGMPCQSERQCEVDTDCPPDAPRCLDYLESCCGFDSLSSRCGPDCPSDTQCPAGWRCRSTGRGCEAIPCGEGYACPAQTVCDSDQGALDQCAAYETCHDFAEAHGCWRLSCSADGDYENGGVCVANTCQETYGSCQGLVA